MDELVTQLVDTVTQNGGSMDWQALVDSVDYSQRQDIPKALKIAKANGQLKRNLRVVEGQRLHTVDVVSGGE